MKDNSRLASSDCFRAFAVLAMVFAGYMLGTEVLSAWLRHAPDSHIILPDLDAPWPIFCFWTKGAVSAS